MVGLEFYAGTHLKQELNSLWVQSDPIRRPGIEREGFLLSKLCIALILNKNEILTVFLVGDTPHKGGPIR